MAKYILSSNISTVNVIIIYADNDQWCTAQQSVVALFKLEQSIKMVNGCIVSIGTVNQNSQWLHCFNWHSQSKQSVFALFQLAVNQNSQWQWLHCFNWHSQSKCSYYMIDDNHYYICIKKWFWTLPCRKTPPYWSFSVWRAVLLVYPACLVQL